MTRRLFSGDVWSISALLAILANGASSLDAQQPKTPTIAHDSATATRSGVGAVTATRIKGATPRLDGRLDDAVWSTASWNSDFTQREPTEGAKATARTEVAFLYDDAALYIGARMQKGGDAPVRALVTRRDNQGSSDQIVVSLDSYHDRRTAYSFGVTAAGVRIDYFHSSDDQYNRDYSFDPVWEAQTEIVPSGWTAELRIPFTQLRFNAGEVQVWGVNLTRSIPALNEEDYLVLVRRNETGWSSRFAELRGVESIAPSRRVELIPYVASSAQLLGNVDPADPFSKKRSSEVRVGGDVKVGLGPNLTLNATINPDFGQVEADPAQVNLSGFETVFPERRPFFVEGSQLLRANNLSLFVSRRIGQGPRYSPSADYVEPILNTTIKGAAKVTGRLPSGLSVGVLGALTGSETARTFSTSTGQFADAVVEPLTSFGVARLQQEFGKAKSTVAVMLTNVNRRIDDGSPIAAILPRNAMTGAFEWNLRFKNGEYVASGAIAFSHLSGDSAAILRIQRAPAHYFGRPDAPYLKISSSRETLTGTDTNIGFSKNAGRFLWQIGAYGEAPGLDINDAGRIGAADDRGINFGARYRQTVPRKNFRSWDVGLYQYDEWDYGGVLQGMTAQLISNQVLRNFWQTSVNLSYTAPAIEDNLTRGGPLMGFVSQWYGGASLSTSPAKKTRWSINPNGGWDANGGWTQAINAGVSFRPGNRIELSVNPGYGHWVNSRQYLTTLNGGTAATFGKRYVFSYIERSELSAQLRLNYSLGPDLTLETYAEPFASTGRYYRTGELPRARSYGLREYGTDGTTLTRFGADSIVVTDGAARFQVPVADFNVLSFRSNVVMRWEWRPGSTAYLVWQQNRGDSRTSGALVRPSSLYDALTANGDNVFAIKLNYWLPF
jgi:hypothetical protein